MASCAVGQRCLVAAGCFRSTGGPFRVRRTTAGAWAVLHEPLTSRHTTRWCRSRRPLLRGTPAVASMHRLLAAPRGALSAGRAALSATPSRGRGPGPPPEAARDAMYPHTHSSRLCRSRAHRLSDFVRDRGPAMQRAPAAYDFKILQPTFCLHTSSPDYCIYSGNEHLGFFFDWPLLPVHRCWLLAEFGCYR